ncbi:hypothetical protein EIN_327490 [Entamoeba invadens IP1]|uniref:Uncharacterized protein n=1 Tax=Entamoeba invadens IP1 TaxID=370355 RepID=A0A0A1TXJ3_ENTIV|nr:hypothetical protein EIN_327490 [Entamoeba invadens IP1]ELP86102.1 hypothetical protein EIN_327490 [Entamoeba invadens IP1]|eukprot:XP_004185448.1 hypothetical protein EIN_327490 [Entamoeba invadens IP1]
MFYFNAIKCLCLILFFSEFKNIYFQINVFSFVAKLFSIFLTNSGIKRKHATVHYSIIVFSCSFRSIRFVVGDMESFEVKGDESLRFKITHPCVQDSNYVKENLSNNKVNFCFLHNRFEFIHQSDQIISRCGQCLRLIGPSNRETICTVSGYFTMSSSSNTTDNFENVIAVPKNLYSLISTNIETDSSWFSQVTVNTGDCNFINSPTLLQMKNESDFAIQAFNFNKPLKKLQIGYEDVHVSEDHMFHFKKQPTGKVKVESYYGDIISGNFDDFDGTKLDLGDQFPKTNDENCPFMPNVHIYQNTSTREKNDFIKWGFYQTNPDFTVDDVEEKDDGIDFVSKGGRMTIALRYNSPIQMGKYYSELIIESEINGSFNLLMANMALNRKKENIYNFDIEKVDVLLKNITIEEEVDGVKTKKIRVFFSKGSRAFSNLLMITFFTSKGNKLSIKNAYIKPRLQKKELECPIDSLDCKTTECEIDSQETELFQKECQPYCGACKTGFQCSSQGKCVTQDNTNSRNQGSLMMILACVVLLFFV